MEESLTFKKARRNLHSLLQLRTLNSNPQVNIYFQPPTNIKLSYPAIVYRSTGTTNLYGDGLIYLKYYEFEIVVITSDPESQIPYDLLDGLEYATITSQYQSDNLYHTAIRVSTNN